MSASGSRVRTCSQDDPRHRRCRRASGSCGRRWSTRWESSPRPARAPDGARLRRRQRQLRRPAGPQSAPTSPSSTSASTRSPRCSRRAARSPGSPSAIHPVQGDVEALADAVPAASFDLVLAHGILEAVDDCRSRLRRDRRPRSVPAGCSACWSAIRWRAVLARALAGDLDAALAELRALDRADGILADPTRSSSSCARRPGSWSSRPTASASSPNWSRARRSTGRVPADTARRTGGRGGQRGRRSPRSPAGCTRSGSPPG